MLDNVEMKKTQVYKWCKHFCEGPESVREYPRCRFFDAQGLVHYKFIPEEHCKQRNVHQNPLFPQGSSEKETAGKLARNGRKMGKKRKETSA
jgi:hypothetical protein